MNNQHGRILTFATLYQQSSSSVVQMYGVVESLLSPVIEDFSSLPIARLFAYFSTCEDVAEFFRVQLLLWREYFQCAPRSFIFQRPE